MTADHTVAVAGMGTQDLGESPNEGLPFNGYGIFRLPSAPAAIVVLLSALPTGTRPFMIAEFYKRDAVVTSGTILFTTVASVISLAAMSSCRRAFSTPAKALHHTTLQI